MALSEKVQQSLVSIVLEEAFGINAKVAERLSFGRFGSLDLRHGEQVDAANYVVQRIATKFQVNELQHAA